MGKAGSVGHDQFIVAVIASPGGDYVPREK